MAETEPDWAAIRRAVENGEGTQDEIAARHGVGKSAISMRKFRGGWMSPRDIEQMMRTEAALDQIAGAMLKRMKRHAKHGDALDARARELAHAACDADETERRLELNARAWRDLAAGVKMQADFTRLLERRRGLAARIAAEAREAVDDRPDFAAFERAVLARLAAGGAGGGVDGADGGGEGSA